jgi:SOS-response transcriptional repressor LexA
MMPHAFSLTPRQYELLHFIRSYMADNGIAPSLQEMADHLELRSKSGVHRMITEMEERGVIERLHGAEKARHRALRLLEAA